MKQTGLFWSLILALAVTLTAGDGSFCRGADNTGKTKTKPGKVKIAKAEGLKATPGKRVGKSKIPGDTVVVKSEPLVLPTYAIEAPDLNPIYFTGRVYQGAQGHTYPYAMYDILTDKKIDKEYNALYLENKFLKICVLPEMGGRILQATDKTDNYEFFYRQHVVKPALIGMIGAWMSGGVEWNIPHHHRASSFMSVDWKTVENPDGSKSIWVGETELRHRMKWSVGLRVVPNRSYLEATVRIMNRSPYLQSMLCWANVSVHCNENYQVIFPPSVQFGTGHSKVDFVDWPINKGVDFSWWKNHTDQFRSVFAWDFDNDFLAGYDHGKNAGTVHFANHHVVGGKKFFLWGNHDRAKMWDQMLTDKDGCYLELMVGAWSDNQPDYSWIAPGEVREFKQYWYPIRDIKHVKNATLDAAVNLERTAKDKAFVGFCATGLFNDAKVVFSCKGKELVTKKIDISPGKPFIGTFKVPAGAADSDLNVALYNKQGKELVSYSPVVLKKEPTPEPVTPTGNPADIKTNEELYLAGLRIEQFHNARLDPMIYYNEALKRDPSDARVNTVVGLRLARQGRWNDAAKHLQTAIARLGRNYTVLKDGEPHYLLGNVLREQGKEKEAADQYWKAIWTTGYQSAAYFALAQLAAKDHQWHKALGLVNSSLETNAGNTKTAVLKALICRRLGQKEIAQKILKNTLKKDPLDYWALVEQSFLQNGNAAVIEKADDTRGDALIRLQEVLEMAVDYGNVGAYDESIGLLQSAITAGTPYSESPLTWYWLGYFQMLRDGKVTPDVQKSFAEAAKKSSDYCFPFRTEEMKLFEAVLKCNPKDSLAYYYNGNLLYWLGQKEEGLAQWRQSAKLNPKFGRVWRNIGFALVQKGETKNAIAAYESALNADKSDPRIFTELDILYADIFKPATERLAIMNANLKTVLKHDDAVIRLVGLYNETGNYQKAIDIFKTRHFHVWEGGRAVHDIFVDAHLLSGLNFRDKKEFDKAIAEFEIAQTYPANLEVGRVIGGGQNAKIYYFLGTVYEAMKKNDAAKKAFTESADPKNKANQLDSELTYFQIAAMQKLGRDKDAKKLLEQFATAVDRRLTQAKKVDEFSKFGEDGTATQRLAKSHYLQGLVHLAQGDAKGAQTAFNDALKLNPNLIWPKKKID